MSSAVAQDRTYAEMISAYDARKTTKPFGWDYVNLFEVDVMRTPVGSERRGTCQKTGCTQVAPIELLGKRVGMVSGHPFTRSARTCAFHFWDNVNHVLWLHHKDS